MKNLFITAIAFLFVTSFSVNAAPVQITINSATMTQQDNDLKAFWDDLDASDITYEGAYSSPTGILFNGGSTNNNKIFRLSVVFNYMDTAVVDFFAGLDAGFGAELFVNGVNLFDTTADLWWRLNPNNSDVISQTINLASGQNTLVLYWGEGSNSGGNQFDITTSVSAPAVISLFALGLIGLVIARRK